MALEFLPLPQSTDDEVAYREAYIESHRETIKQQIISAYESEVRLLTPDEVSSLDAEFKQRGCCLPDPASSFFVGAVHDEKIVAYLVIQSVTHAEPMRVSEGYQHLVSRVVHTAEQIISERIAEPMNVFLMAESGRTAQLAELLGMKTERWMVLSKQIKPATDPFTQAATAYMEGELIQ